MPLPSQIIVFGGLDYDYKQSLRLLATETDNVVLKSFFDRAAVALAEEVRALPCSHRSRGIPTGKSILELISKEGGSHQALEMALTCIYQFASFIRHFSTTEQPYPTGESTHIIGICSGLLTGAAISCSASVYQLVALAVRTIVVAFRVGLVAEEMRRGLALSEDDSATWSVMVPGFSRDAAIETLSRYNEDINIPSVSQVYVSASTPSGVILSGPPPAMEALLAAPCMAGRSYRRTRITALYHAPHIYDVPNVDRVLDGAFPVDIASQLSRLGMDTGAQYHGPGKKDLSGLFRSAVSGILLEPVRIDAILERITRDIPSPADGPMRVIPIGTISGSGIANAMAKTARCQVQVDTSIQDPSASAQSLPSPPGGSGKPKLAIIAYSGRYADANSDEDFWSLLYEGRDVARTVPLQRWDVKTHVDPTLKRKNTSASPYGCWLRDADLFDAPFFGMSPREAPQVDPAQRLALLTTYEAMENAGMVPDATPSTQRSRVGVFFGITSNDWSETNASQDVDTYYIPGCCRAFVPGRQNYFHKFSGPSYCVDTACSSSLAAMHLACNALWQGDIDTAICGGTNVLTNPDITAGLDRGFFLSRTGNCKTFDEEADGYCRGEGVVTMIIKRLEDAIADNDPIQGILLGAYTNHSAEAESITRPHVGAQRAIFKRVLASSAVDPQTVSYIEMHGTGTQAGDAREMDSVLSTFAPCVPPLPDSRQSPLYIGSVKANVGHGESVSGVTALAKVLMMMEKDTIPPHCGIKTKLNSKFPSDLHDRKVRIALEPTPWPREKGRPRRAFINNFSAAGGNSSVLVEEAPDRGGKHGGEQAVDPRSTHVVAVSAKTVTALLANVKDMVAFLEEGTADLASVSYTTTARRTHHRYRLMAHGSTREEVSTELNNMLTVASSTGIKPRFAGQAAFTFTGQGAQYPGMARDLLHFTSFEADLRRLDSLALKQGFPSIMPLIQSDIGLATITEFEPLVVQLTSVCVQVAMARLWRSWGVRPALLIGHSLGEYAALNAAGVISDADTIYLVGRRAQIMEEHCMKGSHSMLVVGAPLDVVGPCAAWLDVGVACRNAPAETVFSGPDDAINRLEKACRDAGVRKVKKLGVPYAFHSSQMDCILDDLQTAAERVTYHPPHTPVLSPLLCEVVTSAGVFSAEYLVRQCRSTVNFAGALETARARNLVKHSTAWIEIGPHPVTIGLIKANLESVIAVPTLHQRQDTWKVLCSSLRALYEAGHAIDWKEYHRSFEKGLRVVRLPAYNWDLKSYWLPYANDWALYKGDAQFLKEREHNDQPSTTCVHRIVEQTTAEDNVTLVAECDLQRPDVKAVSQGHRLNGVPLCTPSIYAEIAFVLGGYLNRRWMDDERLVEVRDMDVQRPLVLQLQSEGPQLLRCRMTLHTDTGEADAEFYSVTPEGQSQEQHAECSVAFPLASDAVQEAKDFGGPMLENIANLRERSNSSSCVQKLFGSTAYRLVSSLATYNKEYMGVAEIIMDSDTYTAAIKVQCCPEANEGVYDVNPFLIDSCGQPAMFVMNGHEHADLEKEVCVNHGWSSMLFHRSLDASKAYEVYVDMSEALPEGIQTGNVFVFDGEEIVALIRGIKAQRVPRRLLNYIIHMRGDAKEAHVSSSADVLVNGGHAAPATVGSSVPSLPNGGLQNATAGPTWNAALTIIMEESGCSMSDLADDTCFADLGVDSMLSLLCASRFREELGVRHEAIIFDEHPTVKELRRFWEGQFGPVQHEEGNSVSPPRSGTASSTPPSTNGTPSTPQNTVQANGSPPDDYNITLNGQISPPATSLLLQGTPTSPATRKTLFLLPDGSGSASAYRHIPFISDSLAIVGVNCPYQKQPASYTGGVENVSHAYVREIRHRQPRGPYILGGWSVGGIFTYRVAQILAEQGEKVSDLVLIDCPVPRGLDYLPKRYFEYCDRIGLFGTVHVQHINGTGNLKDDNLKKRKIPPPSWLIPHFEACIENLHEYFAEPWQSQPQGIPTPTTHIIWASEPIDYAVTEKFEHRPDDPDGLAFLTRARRDFGPCGWESLLPEEEMRFWCVRGASHFSMMRGEDARVLAGIIGEALGCR
ncbi:type I polyketide synthase [Aspergillus mulundensis]|uniref:Uncharacterized protein n=1 Tax=Aspergillus mulundensis TaxID=1810919 RepID=A0A3D8QZL8_9EURO|nr:hypothetical protein DSM5745_09071 [Aspergillus mulundensis]RDW67205.1 hypothetical protein DSM5745_09071 [Aspergillus mulundensis]